MKNKALKSIYDTEDYGKISINIGAIMDKKIPDISYNKLSNLLGTDFDLVSRYANNRVIRVDLDILARFCYVLDCKPEDIIIYTYPSDD